MPYFSISSLHCLCVAKQAIAHILISTPVWNCFPRMSQTPWLGVATVLFCRKKKHSNIHVSESKEACAIYCFRIRENKACNLNSAPCTARGNWKTINSCWKWRFSHHKRSKNKKVKTSPVLRTAAWARAARAPSRGPSHPGPWIGTPGQTDPRRNSRFSPRRDFSHVT